MAYTCRDFPDLSGHKAWAEIDLDALRHNYRLLHDISCRDGCRAICVVKGDAYGHGTAPCVRALLAEGCDFFAVSAIEEAIAVRQTCRAAFPDRAVDILILGYTMPDHVSLLLKYDIMQTVYSADYAAALSAAVDDGCLRVHVKLDTGMNRLGFSTVESECEATVDAIAAIAADPHLALCGIFTHYAHADEEDASLTAEPYARYAAVCRMLDARGIACGIRHTCNSAASVRFPAGRCDAVRFGIMLYGAHPSDAFARCHPLDLRPVMRLCTVVAHVHTLPVGEAVSYGGHWSADHPCQIATLPIGYADGFLRAFTGASVRLTTVSGVHECLLVGNICMDQCMIDATGTDVRCGDTVVLFGDKPERLEALAARAGTITYELFCLITGRLARVYRGE